MTSINRWRIFCSTENAHTTGWLPSTETTRTTCFNDTSHTVVPNSANIIETLKENSTLISTQQLNETAGNFKVMGRLMNIAAGVDVVTKHIVSFPYTINTLEFSVQIGNDNVGDSVDVVVYPKYNIYFTFPADTASGSTVVPIPALLLSKLSIGYRLLITNHTSLAVEETSEILSINTVNGTVTLASPIVNNYTTADYLSFFVVRFETVYFGTVGIVQSGNYLRAAVLPNTMQLEVRYTNKTNTAKLFTFNGRFLY